MNRREFFKGIPAGLGGATFIATGSTRADNHSPDQTETRMDFDFQKSSAALSPDKIVRSACQFCNSLCRLNVHMKDGRIIGVEGETNDPVQAGELCLKADMMTEIYYSPHRLTQPLKRISGTKGSPDSQFAPVSWDEALTHIARKFLDLRNSGEARSIANKTSGRMLRGAGSVIGRFFELLGSPNDTDVGPVCNDAGGNALAWTFGLGNFTNGYGVDPATGGEDLGSSDFLLFLGTNQAETHPVTFAHLLRERSKRNSRLVVVDPRLTPTGSQADVWLPIKPHTDLALVLGIIHHILVNDLHDRRFVTEWVTGFNELKRHILDRGYSVEWAASVTDVAAERIRETAEGYAKAERAAIFCNAGISHQLNAFQTYRSLAILAAITGNVGRPGTGCNFMHNTWPGGLNLPPINHQTPPRGKALPVGPDWFAESILKNNPYSLKALVTAGNPIIGSADTGRVREALKKLDFYVFTGLFMEEAAKYADIILPVCSGLEMEGVYMRRDDRAIRWQEAVVPRRGESRTDIEIWIDLAQHMEKLDNRNPSGYWTSNLKSEWKDYHRIWSVFVENTPGMGGMSSGRMRLRPTPLQWPCPDENHPGVSTLYQDHPSWYEAAEALDPANNGKRFLTPGGRVEIYTEDMDRKLSQAGHSALPVFYTHPHVSGKNPTARHSDRLVTNPVNPQAVTPEFSIALPAPDGDRNSDNIRTQYPLMGMTGRASVVHFSGLTHWTGAGKQLNGVRFIQVHPDTAEKSGIADQDEIEVRSPTGAIRGTALLWEGIRPDTIFVPNSFAEDQLVGDLTGAPRYQPANNLISDQYFDNLSGQQAYKCFACSIRRIQ